METVSAHVQSLTVPDASTMLKAKIHLSLNRVMAMYIGQLEQLADEHDEAMGKLMDALPAEYRAHAHLADIYGDARFEAIRRYILKSGNDSVRELSELVDFLSARDERMILKDQPTQGPDSHT